MVGKQRSRFKLKARYIFGPSLVAILFLNSILVFEVVNDGLPGPPGPYSDSENWSLVLEDDFIGSSINTTIWSHGYPPYEFNCYGQCHNHQGWFAPENVIVENGLLRIKGENYTHPDSVIYEPHYWGDTYLPLNYTTGAITTDGKFTFTYGYVEARQKMPEGPTGFWPAFWTIAGKNPGDYGEIDIMEWLSGENTSYHAALHTAGSGEDLHSQGRHYRTNHDLTGEFHVYGVEWHPSRISFYFDNDEIYRTTDPDDLEHLGAQHLRINLAVGGWSPAPDENTIWPAWYETDWVRVWQYNDYI